MQNPDGTTFPHTPSFVKGEVKGEPQVLFKINYNLGINL
jgi:hypothetical protein